MAIQVGSMHQQYTIYYKLTLRHVIQVTLKFYLQKTELFQAYTEVQLQSISNSPFYDDEFYAWSDAYKHEVGWTDNFQFGLFN